MKALEKDRTRRYETANGLAADIERYLADEPIEACPPSMTYRTRKFMRRHKTAAAAIAAVSMALVVGAGIATGQAIRATNAERTALSQKQVAEEAAERERKQRIEAQQQRQRAEANLRLALEALDEVYLRVMQRRGPKGVQPKNEEEALLRSTLDFYERFADANRAAPESWPLVEEVYGNVLTIRKTLVEQWPQVVGYRRALAAATFGLACLLDSAGRTPEAKQTYEQAASLQEQLVGTFPAVPEYRTDLATTHGQLASLLDLAGQDDEAEEYRRRAEEARSIARPAAQFSAGAPIEFATFTDTTGLELLAEASVVDDRLRLTPAEQNKRGACWIKEKQTVAFGFETVFQFALSGGADGFAFVIQNHELSHGVDVLGYDMPNSLAIEFDTYHHSYDPAGDHISVQTDGTGTSRIDHAYSLGAAALPIELDDGKTLSATIRYVPGTLAIFLDDSAEPALTVPVELAAILELDQGRAWVGFTAGTGSNYQTHDVLSWEFRPLVNQESANAFLRTYPPRDAGVRHAAVAAGQEQPESTGESAPLPEDFPFLEKATAFYQAFAEQNHDDPNARWEIGKAYWRVSDIQHALGNEEEAREASEAAVELWAALYDVSTTISETPDHVRETIVERGKLLTDQKRYEEAVAIYQAFAKQNRDDPNARWEIGKAYWRVSDMQHALGNEAEAKQARDAALELWTALYDRSTTIPETPDHVLETIAERGKLLTDQKQYEEAVAVWSQAIHIAEQLTAESPEVTEYRETLAATYWTRGNYYQESGNIDKAITDLSEAIRLRPEFVNAYMSRSIAYKLKGDFQKAIADCNKVMEFDPKCALAYFNRGSYYRQIGNLDQAIADGSEAIRLSPGDAGSYAMRGAAYREKGDYGKAIADYSEAIRLNPGDAAVYARRGQAYYYSRENDLALQDFSKALTLNPVYGEAYNWRGAVYHKQKESDLALADYHEALELNPDLPNLRHNLAFFLLNCPDPQFRDMARALELAKEAVKASAKDASAWSVLGQAHYRGGDYQGAVEALETSSELDYPRKARNWFFLAMAHWKLGHKERAHEVYQQAVEWLAKNQLPGASFPTSQFRTEAADVLGIEEP